MDTPADVLVVVVVLLFIGLTCLGFALWPVVIVSTIVMLFRQKGWAEAGHVYAACIGSFVGAAGLFVIWAEGVGSEGAWAAAMSPFALAMPFSAGAVLGSILGIVVWASVVRIARWRERRIGEDPQ